MNPGTAIRAIWATCLCAAALNHARILAAHGLLWDYHGVGTFSAAYWSSLTIVDPAAAALLFVRPAIGIRLTVAVIVTNVAHNLAITAQARGWHALMPRGLADWAIASQIAFMLFVLATVRTARRGLGTKTAPGMGGTRPRRVDHASST